ncbi:uncharacterized protein F4817DRAFT_362691 [Daldinia loculata]|uniref:uncharacterized protein n=1 Tax=Daldinia loculata TaxID=103429 RepID=UPI0020C234F1|nr:uncharacterized protein F4817DRAFT_362691 [Daldinia loculata]KAI1641904.1 hypothetical protein F4817DRAFT_362691 [Daldinia loculata]
MASFGNRGGASSPSPAIDSRHDPFVVAASPPSASRHRLSTNDSQLFSLSPNASPTQAKRALEAHLAETDRRMEEAGKLGTALLQQRKELSQRLMEVEKQQAEGELSDDLRQRLAEIEKDYNDVARESARAFLPKQRIPSNEAAAGSPFAPESKGGRRSVSPSNVPNRKFAAEISTSLIAQEEELKEIRGFQQRDENWSLETQAEDRYKKLQQTLTVLQAEKNSTQKELDEVKLNHSRLSEEYAAAVKHHDIELGSAKRNIVIADTERVALRRKIDELTGQNQELAKAVSASQRARVIERESVLGMNQEDSESAQDKTTPEHSPPPSPVKGTPRHSLLESETLKTSLGHAHRTIQGLRSNVHREKTEKLELRRMLQEARDELEKLRNEPPPPPKRIRKAEVKEQRKPLRLLGGLRTVRSEVFSEDSNWEDQPDSTSPATSTLASRSSKFESVAEEPYEVFETANETSDAAFETANEPATETDDFHTGAEEFSSDDDAETETESPSRRRTPRNSISGFQGRPRSGSMHSTASTEDEDFPFGYDAGAPVTLPPLQAKFPLRVSRGAYRRSRQPSEEPAFLSSPQSIASSSVAGTPQQPIKNLAAELGEFDGSDNESYLSATPSRRSIRGRTVSPPPPVPSLPRAIMVDCSTMTDELPDTHTHAADLAALQAEHEKALKEISDEKAFAYATALDELKSKHEEQLSKMQHEELEALRSSHADELAKTLADAQSTYAKELEALKSNHAKEINEAIAETNAAHSRELEALKSSHVDEIKLESSKTKALEDLAATHSQQLENLRQGHLDQLAALNSQHESAKAKLEEELAGAHSEELVELRRNLESSKASEIAALSDSHAKALDILKIEHETAESQKLQELTDVHSQMLENVKTERDATEARKLQELTNAHLHELENLRQTSDHAKSEALSALAATHADEMERLKEVHELEALRISLQTTPPSLGFSTINSTETEPVEISELRSPKRDAFIIPHEDRSAHTSSDTGLGLLGRREDDTRQSPSATPAPETPESKRPFKELSANTNVRPSQKPAFHTSNQGCQTTLTSDGLDQLLKQQGYVSPDSFTITTSRGEVIVTPFDEAEARQRVGDSGVISATDPVAARQIDSPASAQASASPRLPLPLNHREAIEAARTHSSSGGKGPMGPPALPASAYNNSGSRPETPSSRRPLSPSSIVKGTPTPKAGRSSTPGYADVHSVPRMLLRSRQSSVSSFASEIDTRFNIRGEMGMDPSAFGPSTDPRMIQAITQTMIGEYLWKYTRKTGRGEMSENRHRRYFWVHPYTRTLYWSDRDPATGGRTELKAKSIPIEAVRIVGDDNPMPPGLHRKSLIIVSPGRTVKFTCTTGQRHETWFNALSYLLLRTGDESQADAEDVAGQITQEDVDEFNPSINRRPANGNRPRPPPSLSSYNSGATRAGSPRVEVSMSIPTLTPTREREASRSGTLGRLSGYWKSSSINSTFSSLRSKTHIPQEGAIYEASEVPDSAEDLRQIIEEQDRASDRLENVRACCDGKFNEGNMMLEPWHTPSVDASIPRIHKPIHTHTLGRQRHRHLGVPLRSLNIAFCTVSFRFPRYEDQSWIFTTLTTCIFLSASSNSHPFTELYAAPTHRGRGYDCIPLR